MEKHMMTGRQLGCVVVTTGLLVAMMAPAFGQSREDLKRELDKLERRVEELEGDGGGAARIKPSRKNVSLEIYGHVNRAYLFADNGPESESFFVDNDNSGTRLGFRAKANYAGWTAGTHMAFNFETNSTDEISFDDQEPVDTTADDDDGEDFLSLRFADISLKHDTWGSFFIGHGDEAGNGATEIDISGTTLIAESDVDDTAGGLRFENGTKVDQYFRNLDGGRTSRVAYHTPRFFGLDFRVAGRQEGQIQPDFGVFYAAELAGWEAEAAVAYRPETRKRPDRDADFFNGSFSVLSPFGVNLTVAGALEVSEDDDIEDQSAFYAKLGYREKLFSFGETRFSIDYFLGQTNRDAVPGKSTDATSVGGGVIQVIKPLSTELYANARVYSVNLPQAADPHDLVAIMAGVRVRF
jgi:hypothetical protein